MPALNKVLIIGNLTRDPDRRNLPNGGEAVADFGIAMNDRWTGDDGSPREETTFVDVACFGKLAHTVDKYLHKGDPVFVEGRLRLERWEDRETGQPRTRLKVIARSVQFLSSKKGAEV